MPKKWVNFEKKLMKVKKAIDVQGIPRYKALQSRFYPTLQKSKPKTKKKKKTTTKYYIYKGKAYPIYTPKKKKKKR